MVKLCLLNVGQNYNSSPGLLKEEKMHVNYIETHMRAYWLLYQKQTFSNYKLKQIHRKEEKNTLSETHFFQL